MLKDRMNFGILHWKYENKRMFKIHSLGPVVSDKTGCVQTMELSVLMVFVLSRTSSGVLDVSMLDWDLRVQEDLRDVEEVLERADGILTVRRKDR